MITLGTAYVAWRRPPGPDSAVHRSTETLLDAHLPHLLRAACEVSADWALRQSRARHEVPEPHRTTASS